LAVFSDHGHAHFAAHTANRRVEGMSLFGGIEAGGTKFVCGVGTGPEDLRTAQIPTTSPAETVAAAVAYFRDQPVRAVGIGSFGPIDLRTGHITSTPKAGWQDFDLAGSVRRALGVPVGFDTDVNAAALGEARWGAAQGLSDFLYLTVGTGIGGGAVVGGRVLHGLLHPEMGHIRVPRDPAQDPYPGGCPYHDDCLEGLASGPAIAARWGVPARQLPSDHPAWVLEARYLALALADCVCTLSPQRIVLGGGVMQQTHLFGLIREELARLLNGYVRAGEVVPPALGSRSGVLGALVLAERALA
jgi:fructokinase